jgi:hypothetical protein
LGAGGMFLSALPLWIQDAETYKNDPGKMVSALFVDGVLKAGLGYTGRAAGTDLGEMAGMAVGTMLLPGPGTAIGAVVGAAAGNLIGGFAADSAYNWLRDTGIRGGAIDGIDTVIGGVASEIQNMWSSPSLIPEPLT